MELRAEIPPQAREWRNHPSIWKWCRQYSPISEAAHQRWLEKIESDPTIKMFGIWNETEYVGVCGLTSIDRQNQSAEFSLYIAPEHQRNGYGRKALTRLFTHGFRNLNLNRIWGEVFELNHAMKTFLSLGMWQEGCLRKSYYRDGYFINSYIVSMLREDWLR